MFHVGSLNTGYSLSWPSPRQVLPVGCSSSQTYSTMCSFHRVEESFRNGLLWCGSLTGSQILPENLHQCGLFSTDCSSCQEPACVRDVHGSQLCLRHTVCSSRGAGGYLIHCDPQGCREMTWLTMTGITSCRGISALVPGAPPPSASPLTLVSADLFLSCLLSPLSQILLCSIFHPFLNMLSWRYFRVSDGLSSGQWCIHHEAGWKWPSPMRGKASVVFSQKTEVCSPDINKPASLRHQASLV